MNRKYIIYSVLVVTALAINPLLAMPLSVKTTQAKETNSLSFYVAKILYNKGIESEASVKISDEFFAAHGKEFSVMLRNIEKMCSVVSEDELLTYMSYLALQRKSIQLDSYSSLLDMIHKIKNVAPNKKLLKEIEAIASINFAYSQSRV